MSGKNDLNIGTISSLSSQRRSGLSLSGPAALPDLRFLRSFRIPAVEIPNSSMIGIACVATIIYQYSA